MRHPTELEAGSIAHRLVEGQWQYWNMDAGYWQVDREPNPGPESRFNDPVLSFDDTWCEPFEGMED